MIANEFKNNVESDLDFCIYAAGVSNSGCIDPVEFQRDRFQLEKTLAELSSNEKVYYISTCSINNAECPGSPYVEHKIRMEEIVLTRGQSKVIRLPQVAGNSKNPHTLLNFLHERIVKGDGIELKRYATRNIIDVKDVRRILLDIARNEEFSKIPSVLNIANIFSISILDLVDIFESEFSTTIVKTISDTGDRTDVDVEWIKPSLTRCGIDFDANYIRGLIRGYYGK